MNLTNPENMTPTLHEMAKVQSDLLALPFDMAREQYAKAVQAGWIQRSLLASAQFGRTLTALERLTLGPWARTL
jgi:hypothetical protein